eukprot:gnl/MRDRNA2_/MRDRNA2_177920_c0_seq1.p1 gnl/MRDRNA2_/MRDRNA2_177920_c0~~gnl/MRDRNA2_/MRDRNA2_177920_c0_seq1.p1  ORF type:complete len:268 (+),score=38.05 gnl/MRDRNA2_/MRDRNA2_177920_c0_seq1:140-943(+)
MVPASHSTITHDFDKFVGDDLALLITPFFDPPDLASAVSVCVAWRCRTACTVKEYGGARRWLSGIFADALEEDSFDLCRRAVNSSWFEQRNYVVALIVAVQLGQDPLERAMQLLDRLPSFVTLPALHQRIVQHTALDGAETGWVHDAVDACIDDVKEVVMAQELRRQWASAYLLTEDGSEDEIRARCTDVIARWLGLWCCARCVSNASAMRSTYVLRHESLRATDLWKADVLTLGVTESGICSSNSDELVGSVAALSFSYLERRLMG